MNFFYCQHRPGPIIKGQRLCRHCRVAIEECPCVSNFRTVDQSCEVCEGYGWVGILRSKREALSQALDLSA